LAQASFKILNNKPPEWGQKTGFGKYEKSFTPGMLAKSEECVSEEEDNEEDDDDEMLCLDMDTSN